MAKKSNSKRNQRKKKTSSDKIEEVARKLESLVWDLEDIADGIRDKERSDPENDIAIAFLQVVKNFDIVKTFVECAQNAREETAFKELGYWIESLGEDLNMQVEKREVIKVAVKQRKEG